MFETTQTTAFKGSWNQEEQTEWGACVRVCACGVGGRVGGKNLKPKGWEEVAGCMVKDSRV